jgi:hypothetical protein
MNYSWLTFITVSDFLLLCRLFLICLPFLLFSYFSFDSLCTENKGWELVEEAKKEADELIEKMSDAIYFTDPQNRKRPEAPKK